jgi:hypothetical protein
VIESCCAGDTAARDLVQMFAFGLLISAGHCLGMCGPLVCAASLPARGAPGAARESGWDSARSVGAYHAGRVATYALIGALIGALAGFVPGRASALIGQALLSLLAAAALLWVGLGLLGVFPLASLPWAARLSGWLTRNLGGVAGARGLPRRFALGMANGLLPCGPVYTVALSALAAGGASGGAAAMLAFGAGTVPLLAALALGWRWTGERLRLRLHRAGAALAIAMALQLALRGLAALEWVPHARIHEVVLW